MDNFLTGKRLEKFVAIQNCLVPRSTKFSEEQKNESIKSVNDFISFKPDIIAYKIMLFLMLIDIASIVMNFKTFKSADLVGQHKVMDFFFDNKISLMRKGFWGINALAKLGVYSQASIYPDIGYEIQGMK